MKRILKNLWKSVKFPFLKMKIFTILWLMATKKRIFLWRVIKNLIFWKIILLQKVVKILLHMELFISIGREISSEITILRFDRFMSHPIFVGKILAQKSSKISKQKFLPIFLIKISIYFCSSMWKIYPRFRFTKSADLKKWDFIKIIFKRESENILMWKFFKK